MKTSLLTIFLLFFTSAIVLGQAKISKSTRYIWDGNLAEWRLDAATNYEYGNGSDVSLTTESYDDVDDKYQIRGWYEHRIVDGNMVFQVDSFYLGDHLWNIQKSESIYENGQLIEGKYTSGYFSNAPDSVDVNFPVSYSKADYHYNDEGSLAYSESFSLPIGEAPVLIGRLTYTYDESGCLVEEFYDKFVVSGGFRYKNIYSVDEHCTILSKSEYNVAPNGSLSGGKLRTVSHSEVNSVGRYELDSLYNYEGIFGQGAWVFSHANERQFNGNGRLVEQNVRTQDDIPSKEIWVYDHQNRLELYERERIDTSGFYLDSQQKYDYTYDENDFLIAEHQETFNSYNPSFIRKNDVSYQNFCDGNPAVVTFENYQGGAGYHTKTYNEYLNGVDCDFEKEQNSIEIFPNPSNGIFKIKGHLLGGASTKIKVFNFVGQLVFEVKVPEQSYLFDLDLSHLITGNYVLFVENGDYFSREKITVFK